MNGATRKCLQILTGSREQNERKVFIISGAPGAGKTTYVKEHIKPCDICIDLDSIACALQGGISPRPNYNAVMDEVLAVRDVLYKTISSRSGKWENAYVITSTPNRLKLQDLSNQLNAEIYEMPVTENQCIEHISNDNLRNKEHDIKLCREWYSQNRQIGDNNG